VSYAPQPTEGGKARVEVAITRSSEERRCFGRFGAIWRWQAASGVREWQNEVGVSRGRWQRARTWIGGRNRDERRGWATMANGGLTTPFPQIREGREGWGSARRGQVEEKQGGLDAWRRRGRRAPGGDCGWWGISIGNGAEVKGRVGQRNRGRLFWAGPR
jgi:hypothetical protein